MVNRASDVVIKSAGVRGSASDRNRAEIIRLQ
jgi:hypothetical protein